MLRKTIKYFVMDVDGTLTDGKIYMGHNGEIFKAFNVKDGYGIRNILIPSGIVPIIITGRNSDILKKRCEELGISRLYQGILNKQEVLLDIVSEELLNTVAYIGDDMNDFACMNLIKNAGGSVACPADAVKKIIEISDFVCEKRGGDGVIREYIEWLME